MSARKRVPRRSGPPERTAMAWQRSELAVGFVAVFTAAAAVRIGVGVIAVLAAIAALVAVSVALSGRPREMRDGREHAPPWPWLPNIAIATAVVAALGAALGIVELFRAW